MSDEDGRDDDGDDDGRDDDSDRRDDSDCGGGDYD